MIEKENNRDFHIFERLLNFNGVQVFGFLYCFVWKQITEKKECKFETLIKSHCHPVKELT
jgi:hypothetical protein